MLTPIVPSVRWVQTLAAAHCVLVGGSMVLFSFRYTAPAYIQAFRVMGPTWWGAAFTAAGVAVLGALYGPSPKHERFGRYAGAVASMLMASLMVGWSCALLWAVALGEAGTVGGPLWVLTPTLMYLSSVVRFGTGRRHGRS